MRALIYGAIIADSTLNGLGITDANSFAVDVDTPQTRPFLQLRWGVNQPALSQTQIGRRLLTIWAHDQPGDYTKIDAIITRLRSLLPTLEGMSNGSGHLIAVEWSGDSEDLSDDGHRTIARWTSFSIVGSGQ
jgi:hypothetical protein